MYRLCFDGNVFSLLDCKVLYLVLFENCPWASLAFPPFPKKKQIPKTIAGATYMEESVKPFTHYKR